MTQTVKNKTNLELTGGRNLFSVGIINYNQNFHVGARRVRCSVAELSEKWIALHSREDKFPHTMKLHKAMKQKI